MTIGYHMRNTEVIHPIYLPFTEEQLAPHFLTDVEGQLEYYRKSARRYRDFAAKWPDPAGIAIADSRAPCQIQKDERFWTATALKHLIESASSPNGLAT